MASKGKRPINPLHASVSNDVEHGEMPNITTRMSQMATDDQADYHRSDPKRYTRRSAHATDHAGPHKKTTSGGNSSKTRDLIRVGQYNFHNRRSLSGTHASLETLLATNSDPKGKNSILSQKMSVEGELKDAKTTHEETDSRGMVRNVKDQYFEAEWTSKPVLGKADPCESENGRCTRSVHSLEASAKITVWTGSLKYASEVKPIVGSLKLELESLNNYFRRHRGKSSVVDNEEAGLKRPIVYKGYREGNRKTPTTFVSARKDTLTITSVPAYLVWTEGTIRDPYEMEMETHVDILIEETDLLAESGAHRSHE